MIISAERADAASDVAFGESHVRSSEHPGRWLKVEPIGAAAWRDYRARSLGCVDDRSQGTVAGAFSAMTAIGWTVGPLIAALGAVVGLSFTFVLAALGCAISIYFFRLTRGESQQVS